MSSDLIKNSIAALAFVVALYALLARERKTPHITNFIFPPAALVFSAVLLLIVNDFVQAWGSGSLVPFNARPGVPGSLSTPFPQLQLAVMVLANASVIAAAIWIIRNVWRLHNRQVNFRDDNWIRNISLIRSIRHRLAQWKWTRSYEHSPVDINPQHITKGLQESGITAQPDAQTRRIAICHVPFSKSDLQVCRLAAELLRLDWLVQYTTCARNPSEWVMSVKQTLGTEWAQRAGRIVVVDGYTPHFGFTDSIHVQRTTELRREGVIYVQTPESFAGLHTATAEAFNAFKKQAKRKAAGSQLRLPTLVIYEGCHALVDLESAEQYRIFLRHVLTSEPMWGGMLTLFVEPELDSTSEDLVKAYCDVVSHAQEQGAGNAASK